jgi:sulfite oxidase
MSLDGTQLSAYDKLFNAGAALDCLCEEFITETAYFFTRNHGEIPEVDVTQYTLTVGGNVQNPLRLTLNDLQQFPTQYLAASLQCAGNRRQELIALAPIDDQLGWGAEAVGNAEWEGIALRDILQVAGVQGTAGHVAFLGLDQVDDQDYTYGSSIPLEKALCNEVLLAWSMNGKPLTAMHGYPLRVVVPGYIGARSVKWLSEISVQDTPSENYYQQVAYRLHDMMLGELSVNSAITIPNDGATLPAGTIPVRGYAMTGGNRTIEKVEVSLDDGKTWQSAELGRGGRWTWRLWHIDLELELGDYELVIRAWDSAANTQPSEVEQVWNLKGYMNNAWHRIKVSVR